MTGNPEALPEDFVAGNHFDKYASTNPIVRWMMNGFLDAFGNAIDMSGQTDVFEIGCGEGHLLLRMAERGMTARGCDISPDVVETAHGRLTSAGYHVPLSVQAIEQIDPAENAADLVVCCEVLEHVDNPPEALDILAQTAKEHVLVSVPREPIWRILNMCRGRYLTDFGNTPGHFHHWSAKAFIRFLETRLDVVNVWTPLPWTMALCRVRHRKDGA